MNALLYVAAGIAVLGTVLMITRLNAVHALLFLAVSLLATAVVFFLLGAPFVAALEVIIYAGAIMVLFVFVVMMLDLGSASLAGERLLRQWSLWILPGVLALVLLAEFLYVVLLYPAAPLATAVVGPERVGVALFTRYGLGVELASFVLLSGLVGAYHVGRRYGERMRPDR